MPLQLTAVIAILSLLGLADAAYLTVLHYQNTIPPCTLSGCETVLTSKYATIFFGIPTALLGVVYSLTVFIAMLLFAQTRKIFLIKVTCIITSIAFILAIILVYIQAFVLHAFCQYCLASEFIDTLLFIFSWFLLKLLRSIK